MEKHGIFFYIFIAVILLFCLRIYYESDAFNLTITDAVHIKIVVTDDTKLCVTNGKMYGSPPPITETVIG